jgi:hypothetical protein
VPRECNERVCALTYSTQMSLQARIQTSCYLQMSDVTDLHSGRYKELLSSGMYKKIPWPESAIGLSRPTERPPLVYNVV